MHWSVPTFLFSLLSDAAKSRCKPEVQEAGCTDEGHQLERCMYNLDCMDEDIDATSSEKSGRITRASKIQINV